MLTIINLPVYINLFVLCYRADRIRSGDRMGPRDKMEWGGGYRDGRRPPPVEREWSSERGGRGWERPLSRGRDQLSGPRGRSRERRGEDWMDRSRGSQRRSMDRDMDVLSRPEERYGYRNYLPNFFYLAAPVLFFNRYKGLQGTLVVKFGFVGAISRNRN